MSDQSETDRHADEIQIVTELHHILRPLEELEEKMRHFYEHCREQFREDAEASAVFARLAFEERSHVAQVQYLRRVVDRNKESMAPVELDLKELEFELVRLQSAIPALHQMSLMDVLEFALACERGAAELHSRAAIVEANPSLAELLRSLGQADRVHIARLEKFLEVRRTSTP